jgi:phenylalanyl-tRNA synthetase beta chain
MKISFRWLRDVFPTACTPEEAAAVLTATGLEVEGIERYDEVPGGLAGVVVGRILTAERHPDADRLQVCTVDLGTGTPAQIVCGAANARPGITVVAALPGATLHPVSGEPFTIRTSKIRGVESQGMLCAEDELGLGTGHDGILELDPTCTPGMPAASALGVGSDAVLEIGLTPNRTDAMSHIGVARDLRAGLLLGTVEDIDGDVAEVALPDGPPLNFGPDSGGIGVEVQNAEACPRYLGLLIDGVRAVPSPPDVAHLLTAIGLKPVNAIVDATNYVLHTLGTPLHAFDADRIAGSRIVVRNARPGERLTTLDAVERELHPDDLVIADAERPLALAGVFGGAGSGVGPETTRVFLESAWFAPVGIRKTARRHGLSTDASFRYERGVDPALTGQALRLAARLITEWAGGTAAATACAAEDAAGLPGPARVRLGHDAFRRLIGVELAPERQEAIWAALEFKVVGRDGSGVELEVPAYRSDVKRPADVIEDMLRIHGFDRVPLPGSFHMALPEPRPAGREPLRRTITDLLVARGFTEVMHNSLTRSAYVERFLPDARAGAIAVLNPLSSDLDVLRSDLLFQLLETVARNRHHQHPDLRLCEWGRVYRREAEAFVEEERLVLVATGRGVPESWNRGGDAVDHFGLKGEVEAVMRGVGMEGLVREEGVAAQPLLVGGSCWRVGDAVVAWCGPVRPEVCAALEVEAPVVAAVVDVEVLAGVVVPRAVARPLAKFPAVRRDLSLVLPKDVAFATLREIAFKTEPKLLRSVGLFDVYSGDALPDGTVSYAMSLRLQDTEKTLNDHQIERSVQRIVEALGAATGARLR